MHITLLKRLDIIKNAVAMEDEELIAMQIAKLEVMPLDAQVAQIVALIKAQKFQDVIQLIEQYKCDSMGLVLFDDPQIQGLKLELKLLEINLNDKSDEFAELERVLNEFNNEYYMRLGSLIQAILKLKIGQSEQDPQAQQEYEEFTHEFEQQKNDPIQELSPDQQQELKIAYRNASKLCHPDKLPDEFKSQGTEIFKELARAYRNQNLSRVNEILQQLQSGKPFKNASEIINNKEELLAKIASLRLRLTQLESEINALIQSEQYQKIIAIKDREAYFAGLEKELCEELHDLNA